MMLLSRSSIVPTCWLVVAIQLAIVCGCATLPEPPARARLAHDSGQALLAEWLTRGANLHSLQGIAKVRVQTPERTVNGTQVLLVDAPARLRAETLSPFGTPLLVMTANDTEIAVLIPGDNKYYRGRPTAENLGRFTRLPLRPADLIGILLYRPPLIAYRSLTAFQLPDGGWQLTLESGQRRQELQFDAGRRLIGVRYLYDDELQLSLNYGDFDADPSRPPHRIDLELPQQNTRASLNFKEVEANRQLLPEVFALNPPDGAVVTVLEDQPATQISPDPERE